MAASGVGNRQEVFAGSDACEDARLAHLDDFDVAMAKDGRAALSAAERERLTALARHAFGRCVPALALSGRR